MTLEDANFRELNYAMRHYSNLRFLIIPIYFTINGAMFAGLVSNVAGTNPGVLNICALGLALIVSGVFLKLEKVLNSYLNAFYQELIRNYPNNFWQRRPETGEWVHKSICILYAATAVAWCVVIGSKFISTYCTHLV
jgi:hypothetical protein